MKRIAPVLVVLLLVLPGLAHAAASGDGLYATYFDQNGQQYQFFTGNTVKQVDPTIDFDWGNGAPVPGIGAEDFSVRWTGEIETPNWSGGNNPRSIGFRTRSDDGVRVYIDGTLVIDNWTDHGAAYDTGTINLRRNRTYSIVIEYYERGGGAVMEFEWDLPGGGADWQTVPQAYLYSLRPPGIVSVFTGSSTANICGDLEVLEVTFDIPLDDNEAEDGNNYFIPGGPDVDSAVLSADGLTVTLALDAPLTEGQVYSLQVADVESTDGIVISPDPATKPFTPLAGIPQPGLRGSYYDQNGVNGAYFTGNNTQRTDAQVDFDWGTGAPPGVGNDDFSVRWEGIVEIPDDFENVFYTTSDDGVRVWVNGALVINQWVDQSATTHTGNITLPAGQYPIVVEYYENGGDAVMQLGWRVCTNYWFGWCFGTQDQVIPAANLFHCTDPYVLDHFGISVAAGTASTCAAQDVGISARNSSNFVLSGYTGNIDINVSSNHGDWSGDATNPPQGTLANGIADDGAAAYGFSAVDGGAIELDFLNVHADDLSITVTDTASGVTSTSGVIAFRDNAFVIAPVDALGNEVVAGRPHAIEAAMWRRDPGTGNCAIAGSYAGTKNLKAWITRDGADPGGTAPAIDNGTSTSALPDVAPGAVNLALDFTSGVSTFDLATTDVGKYVVHLLDDTRTFATGVDIGGMTGSLTTRPFALAFRNITAGATPNAMGWAPGEPAFTGAGNDVNLQLAGVLWSGADDANNDGVADGYGTAAPVDDADLSDNGITPSFAADGAIGIHAAVPAAGSINPLTFTTGDFTGGVASLGPLRYSEVGSVLLQADAGNYLGSAGVDVTGVSRPVGRFTPAYFDVAVTQQGCGTFTYSGQPIANVSVTAYNAQGAVTQNFSGASGYGKDVFFSSATAIAGSFGAGNAGAIDATEFGLPGPGSAVSNLLTFAFNDPETQTATLYLRATDADGASSIGHVEGSTAIRGGRAVLLDRATSSLTGAQMSFMTEWWQETAPGVFAWATNNEDVCTAGDVAVGNFGFVPGSYTGNLDPGDIGVTGFGFGAGTGVVSLSAAGVGNEGDVDLVASVPDWLEFDWNGSGREAPAGTLTVRGIFQAEDGFIDRREVVQ